MSYQKSAQDTIRERYNRDHEFRIELLKQVAEGLRLDREVGNALLGYIVYSHQDAYAIIYKNKSEINEVRKNITLLCTVVREREVQAILQVLKLQLSSMMDDSEEKPEFEHPTVLVTQNVLKEMKTLL